MDDRYKFGMDTATKLRLAHTDKSDLAACAIRLAAARLVTGLRQNEMAIAIFGADRRTKINNMERGLNYPSREVMTWLFRNHRIDFNFMMLGLYAQLPGDVQEVLFEKLVIANNEWDRKEHSNPGQAGRLTSQPQT